MSAQAPALRIPGRSSKRRAEWYALAALVLIAALAAVLVFTTRTSSTTTSTTVPASGSIRVHSGFHSLVVPVSGEGVRVGGTSDYRYHPLPATNYSAPAAADPPAGVRVGGAGAERFHPLP
jgi:hypothetical protein